jgi:hypothetical protein
LGPLKRLTGRVSRPLKKMKEEAWSKDIAAESKTDMGHKLKKDY